MSRINLWQISRNNPKVCKVLAWESLDDLGVLTPMLAPLNAAFPDSRFVLIVDGLEPDDVPTISWSSLFTDNADDEESGDTEPPYDADLSGYA